MLRQTEEADPPADEMSGATGGVHSELLDAGNSPIMSPTPEKRFKFLHRTVSADLHVSGALKGICAWKTCMSHACLFIIVASQI